MSKEKELLIGAIKNGIVIDHIPSKKVFLIVEILKLKNYSQRITVATNMPSSSLVKKGIILQENELNNISLIAPDATINIIEDYEVVEKTKLERLDEVEELVKCDNPKCISNHENIKTKFVRLKEENKYKCFYCEKIISEDEIQLKTK